MHPRLTILSLLGLTLGLVDCAAPAQAQPPAASRDSAHWAEVPPPASSGVEAAPASTATPGSSASADQPSPPPPPNTPALPELTVQLLGLHIGGGPNDTASKQPFIATLKSGDSAYLDCYRLSEEPEKGGTFGVDLRVAREGGSPTVQQVRTGMRGEELRRCLETAFTSLSFGPPPKGPTVMSVSIRFTLKP